MLAINEKYESNNLKIIQFPAPMIPAAQPQKEKYVDKEIHIPVQPIRELEYIQKAKIYFLNKPERFKGQNIRDYTIFVLGINLARRCGDLLHLRIHNVLDTENNIKSNIIIQEQKTGKIANLIITPVIKEALEMYFPTLGDINMFDPLFPSRNKDQDGNKKPMTLKNFYYKMQGLKAELEIVDPLGTHSLRKTWAYLALKNNKDDAHIVSKISKALNHSNIETTFRYLGIEQEELDALFIDNQL